MDELDQYSNGNDTDLDLSFTSCASDRTTSARSSLTLSFNDRLSVAVDASHRRPHRRSDPHWSAINAATNLSPDGRLHLSHLKLTRLLGAGDLGRVFLCRLRDSEHASFALKVVDRDALGPKKLEHARTEAEILSTLDHPFLPTLYAHLEVSHYTCLLIDYCPGGDLHRLLRNQPQNRFSLHAARFFAAEVLVALEYLHANGVVYRDLKPENVLLRADGHVMLSDFDLCFRSHVAPTFDSNNRPRKSLFGLNNCFSTTGSVVVAEFVAEPTEAFSRSCVGTHEYLAPELVSGNGHGNGVDWWAFGVFVYELLYGTTPFKGANKESTLRNIASGSNVRFPEIPEAEAQDLIERLLVKDPSRRLGCARGATDLKRHPFFDGIKWPLIRTYRPPSEVRGLGPRPAKAQVSVARTQKTKRWSWKGIRNMVIGTSRVSRNNNNTNYYHYVKARKHV